MASFPWYGTATSVFTSWANALRAEASSWNDFWGKVKDGNVQFGDWAKVMAGSVEAFTSLSEQLWYTLWGPAAPPWSNVPFPPKEAVPVRILKAVNKDNPIDPVPLTLLGGHQVAPTLYIQVGINGPYELSLFVDDANWQQFQAQAQVGQYVGLVFSRDHADPIAIVSLRVTQQDIDRLRAAPAKIQEIAVIKKE